MGQLVSVVEKPSHRRGIVRFEANRSLTGQGHEHFLSPDDAIGPRPAAELARRLFATGQIEGVHIYSNIVTVDLQKGAVTSELVETVRDLYQYWKPGMEPAVFEAPAEEAAVSGGGSGGEGDGGGGAESAYTRLVPEVLRERSQAALAKWRANH